LAEAFGAMPSEAPDGWPKLDARSTRADGRGLQPSAGATVSTVHELGRDVRSAASRIATVSLRAAVLGLALLGCGKRTVSPPAPNDAGDADDANIRRPPAFAFGPPLTEDARPMAAGSYAGSFRAHVGIMHNREHTSHATTGVRATLRLHDDRAELCLQTDHSSSSSRSPYIQERLADGGRAAWKDTSEKSRSSGGFVGTVTRSPCGVEIALSAEPTACGDAGVRDARLPRKLATLHCTSVKRIDGKDATKVLVACQWIDEAPYEGPGLVLPTTSANDATGAPRHRTPPAKDTWMVLALDAGIEAISNEGWSSPTYSFELR
jgi:hypothetical protein